MGMLSVATMKLDQLDFNNDQLAKMQERQRLGNVLAVCQCLLLVVLICIVLVKF